MWGRQGRRKRRKEEEQGKGGEKPREAEPAPGLPAAPHLGASPFFPFPLLLVRFEMDAGCEGRREGEKERRHGGTIPRVARGQAQGLSRPGSLPLSPRTLSPPGLLPFFPPPSCIPTLTMRILLVGYSVRMLAEMAVRAGYEVFALDYFGDADLRALCPGLSLRHDFNGLRYDPGTLVRIASTLTFPAVVYGSSLENHPGLVARLARGRRLLGNRPATLRGVRDPFRLGEVLRSAGRAFPETVAGAPVRADSRRRWLLKPLRSGGGHAVRVWTGGPVPAGTVLQERRSGMVGSAVFVADGRRAVLLGVTEQLIGRRAFGAQGFRYCGNLVPPRRPPDEREALVEEARAVAAVLTESFGLQGVNGIDFVWSEGRLWTIEVNPRPPASLEPLEMVYGYRAFDLHVRAFDGDLPDFDLRRAEHWVPAAGKAVLYATEDGTVGDTSDWTRRGIRDVPHPGEFIPRGRPVCTLRASGATPGLCLRRLRRLARWVRARHAREGRDKGRGEEAPSPRTGVRGRPSRPRSSEQDPVSGSRPGKGGMR